MEAPAEEIPPWEDQVEDTPEKAKESAIEAMMDEASANFSKEELDEMKMTHKEGDVIKIKTTSSTTAETIEDSIDDCAGGDF